MYRYATSLHVFITVIASVLTILLPNQGVTAQETVKIDAGMKAEVINKVADIMRDYYVFAEVGEQMGEYIRTRHSNGVYNDYADVEEFCNKVTTDLREISHDKHIFVFYSPEEAKEVAARNGSVPSEEIKKIDSMYLEIERRTNFGFRKIEILDGNIGYLDLCSFSEADEAYETAAGAMSFLSSADAIMIDLRDNGGGSSGLVSFLASYFFNSDKVPLTGVYMRSTDTIEQTWTHSYIPGKRMPKVALYILTSSRTFSAAEDFCYSLKQLKRAKIIGEKTKGGAHPVDVRIVKGNILTQISIGNSVNPITKTNWEGVGVEPDIETSAAEALHTAHLLALKNLLSKQTDDAYGQQLQALIENLE